VQRKRLSRWAAHALGAAAAGGARGLPVGSYLISCYAVSQVVKAARYVAAACIAAPTRALGARHACLLVRAGVASALAAALRPRPGWRAAADGAVHCVSSLIMTLRPPDNRAAASDVPRGLTQTFVREFAAAGGLRRLAALLPGPASMSNVFVLLCAACPAALTRDLHNAIACSVGCRFDAVDTIARFKKLRCLLEAAPALLTGFQCDPDVLRGAALPLLFALATHPESAALRAAAAGTLGDLVQLETFPTGPRPEPLTMAEWQASAAHAANEPIPWRALNVSIVPSFVADDHVFAALFGFFVQAESAEDLREFAPALITAFMGGNDSKKAVCTGNLQQLAWLVCIGDAAQRCRHGPDGPFRQQARGIEMGRLVSNVLGLVLSNEHRELMLGILLDHPRSEWLLKKLNQEVGLLERTRALEVLHAVEAEEQQAARGEAPQVPRRARFLDTFALPSVVRAQAVAAHAAGLLRGERTTRLRALVASLAVSDADSDADEDEGRLNANSLIVIAQTGCKVFSAQHVAEDEHVSEDEQRSRMIAHSVGLHLVTDFPELLVCCEHGHARGIPDEVLISLCQSIIKAAGTAATAAADAAQEEEDDAAEEEAPADSDDQTRGCVLDAPVTGAAARWAADGLVLRECDAGVLAATWKLLNNAGSPPQEEVDALVWRFAPPAAEPELWHDLGSRGGGAGFSGFVYELHMRVSVEWAVRASDEVRNGVSGRLHRLPQIQCDLDAVLDAHPALLAALRTLHDAAPPPSCASCPSCVLARDVGACCALPGCMRVVRITGDAAAGEEERKKTLRRCGACMRAAYCCPEHIKQDWKRHKRECRAASAENDA
jgi:hypothetical protein